MRAAEAPDVKELASWSEQWCVSAFVPGHEPEGRQDGDLLRLRNMLRAAEGELVELGMRRPDAAELVARGVPDELSDRSSPAFHRGGFGVFVSPGMTRAFRIPVDMPELVTVGRRFHLKPLLALLERDRRFFVLTLRRGRARVYLGGLEDLEEIEVPGMPASFEDAMQYDEIPATPRWNELNRADHLPEDEMRYLRLVAGALNDALEDETLVVGGTEDLVAAFPAMAQPRVAPRFIDGNPDAMSDAELHRRALAIVDDGASIDVERDAARFSELNGTGRASAVPGTVLEAARHGRVDTIFVASHAQAWGRPGEDPDEEAHRDARRPGDEDLLDEAAAAAWQSGATVHVVTGDVALEGTPIGAVFRY